MMMTLKSRRIKMNNYDENPVKEPFITPPKDPCAALHDGGDFCYKDDPIIMFAIKMWNKLFGDKNDG